MDNPKFLVVTVTRNDGILLKKLAKSIINQTLIPDEWIIVCDSSVDGTEKIMRNIIDSNDWIGLVSNSGFQDVDSRGERISRLFTYGINCSTTNWNFCSKIDADMELKPNYFEKIYAKFSENPSLGIASGNCVIRTQRGERMETVTPGHTRGGLKTYRRGCFEDINGIDPVDGWDTIDNVRAEISGWMTENFKEILVFHARPTGSRAGLIKTSYNEGKKAHFLGYHPAYLFLRATHRSFSRPILIAGFAMLVGFIISSISFSPRIEDSTVSGRIRDRHISRLTFGLFPRGR